MLNVLLCRTFCLRVLCVCLCVCMCVVVYVSDIKKNIADIWSKTGDYDIQTIKEA